jgi:PAS domain S-box-containing protein
MPEFTRDEKRLIDFVDTASIGLHWVAADGTILWANAADYEPLGYTAEEYIGHNIDQFHADPAVLADILRRLAAGERLHEYEARLRCKDGSIRHVSITSSVLFEDGKFLHTRCFTRDITDKKTIEDELEHKLQQLTAEIARREQLEAELHRASAAKDEFLAILGHELRNPLAPILTALDLLKLRGVQQREHEVIERQVRHLTRLVEDLLDVSRIARGKVELRKEVVDVGALIRQAVESVEPIFQKQQHRLVIDIPTEELPIDADAVRIAQVFVNLLSNAARYTPSGGEVRVSAERKLERIVVRVKDNGTGIDAKLLPRIFELFVQGKRSSDRSEGGLGLGLAIVHNLVRMHGGTVAAHSDGPAQGSEFVVELPRSAAQHAPATVSAGERERAGTKRRVLVVDDNTDAADMLGHVLRSQGHEVVVANTGPDALKLCADWKPQVAVLDIGLPVMDGYELATKLRGLIDDCRLIALTGYGREVDRARAREAGFDMHLVKPIALDAIVREISA